MHTITLILICRLVLLLFPRLLHIIVHIRIIVKYDLKICNISTSLFISLIVSMSGHISRGRGKCRGRGRGRGRGRIRGIGRGRSRSVRISMNTSNKYKSV